MAHSSIAVNHAGSHANGRRGLRILLLDQSKTSKNTSIGHACVGGRACLRASSGAGPGVCLLSLDLALGLLLGLRSLLDSYHSPLSIGLTLPER